VIGEEKQKLKEAPTMSKHIFVGKKADFVYSYIFLQLPHYDAVSTLKIDPGYCTVGWFKFPFFFILTMTKVEATSFGSGNMISSKKNSYQVRLGVHFQ